MANTLRPSIHKSPSPVTAHGDLFGILTNRSTSGVVSIGIAAALATCGIVATVIVSGQSISVTHESDLQAALTHVVRPLQYDAALESRVPSVPSYWYSDDAAIVCQVGDYCIKLETAK